MKHVAIRRYHQIYIPHMSFQKKLRRLWGCQIWWYLCSRLQVDDDMDYCFDYNFFSWVLEENHSLTLYVYEGDTEIGTLDGFISGVTTWHIVNNVNFPDRTEFQIGSSGYTLEFITAMDFETSTSSNGSRRWYVQVRSGYQTVDVEVVLQDGISYWFSCFFNSYHHFRVFFFSINTLGIHDLKTAFHCSFWTWSLSNLRIWYCLFYFE